jgi:hypothetical protein
MTVPPETGWHHLLFEEWPLDPDPVDARLTECCRVYTETLEGPLRAVELGDDPRALSLLGMAVGTVTLLSAGEGRRLRTEVRIHGGMKLKIEGSTSRRPSGVHADGR